MKTTETLFYEISKVLNADEGVGKLISVAARPGMGKTTLCLRMAVEIVMLNETKALFFSLEESKNKLINILSDKWNLASENLAKIQIEDTPAVSIDYIEKRFLRFLIFLLKRKSIFFCLFLVPLRMKAQ